MWILRILQNLQQITVDLRGKRGDVPIDATENYDDLRKASQEAG